MKKILIVAGGTGGHIFPALAVAKELNKNNTIEWLGSKKGMENKIIPNHNITLNNISITGLRGKNKLSILKGVFLLFISFFQTLIIFYKFKPDVIFTTGGFVSGVSGVVAKLLNKPLVIQEQNAIAGTTNKLLAKLTPFVFQAFDNTLAKATTSGNPVLFKPHNKTPHQGLNCLVLGGSLGAKPINEVVNKLNLNINIWHQTGKQHFEEINQNNSYKNRKISAFIDDMAKAYAWADVVICRAGAMTISELMLSKTASILIPLPYAIDNHQLANAKILENNQAAIILEQKNLTPKKLEEILNSLNQQKLVTMGNNAYTLAKPNATQDIVNFINQI